MSIAKKHNRESLALVNIQNTEGFEYESLGDLFKRTNGKTVKVEGFYIGTKGNFGDAPVMVLRDRFVNLPAHLLDTVIEILSDKEDREQIAQGHLGVKVYDYYSEKYKKVCYSVEWVDIDTPEETLEQMEADEIVF